MFLLLTDANAFVAEVSKALLDVGGAGILHIDTDTSVCVTLITAWGGVSDLGGRGGGPQVEEGCEEGIGSLCEPLRPLICSGVHGCLGNGGEWGRSQGSGTYHTGIDIGIILRFKGKVLVVGVGGAYGGGWEGMHCNVDSKF